MHRCVAEALTSVALRHPVGGPSPVFDSNAWHEEELACIIQAGQLLLRQAVELGMEEASGPPFLWADAFDEPDWETQSGQGSLDLRGGCVRRQASNGHFCG